MGMRLPFWGDEYILKLMVARFYKLKTFDSYLKRVSYGVAHYISIKL